MAADFVPARYRSLDVFTYSDGGSPDISGRGVSTPQTRTIRAALERRGLERTGTKRSESDPGEQRPDGFRFRNPEEESDEHRTDLRA